MALKLGKLDPLPQLTVSSTPVSGPTNQTPLSLGSQYNPADNQHYTPMPYDPVSQGGMNLLADLGQGVEGHLRDYAKQSYIAQARGGIAPYLNKNLPETDAVKAAEQRVNQMEIKDPGQRASLITNLIGDFAGSGAAIKSLPLFTGKAAETVAFKAPEALAPAAPIPEGIIPSQAAQVPQPIALKVVEQPTVNVPQKTSAPLHEPAIPVEQPFQQRARLIGNTTGDATISNNEMQDIINTHRQRFGDENIRLTTPDENGVKGHYQYHNDMITLNEGKADVGTVNHESIHKAIGQFLSDNEIEGLYKDIVKIRGGKKSLQAKYQAGGYNGISWRGAAEEEIANTFKDYMQHGYISKGDNLVQQAAYWAHERGLPESVGNVLYKLGNAIDKHFGGARTAAQQNLYKFYDKVDNGGFSGAVRRDSKYVEPQSPVVRLKNATADAVMNGTKGLTHTKVGNKAFNTALDVRYGRGAEDGAKLQREKPKTGIDEIDKAIQDMHDHYNNSPQFENGSLWDLQELARGKADVGKIRANNLGKALTNNLTKEERQAVYDSLQGVENKNLTPRAAKVAEALKPLQETAHGIRAAIKPTIGKVTEYAPRIVRSTLSNAVRTAANGVGAKIKSLANLGSLESKFSNARQNAKFVDEQGNAIYGTQKQLGLVQKNGENRFEDAKGTTYKQTTSNTHELNANTGVDYIHDISPVQSIYHGDTSRLHVRSAAIDELKTNPNNHGLFTADQVEANGLHDQMREVNVNGLKDENGNNFWASAKDAKQLERSRLFGRPDTRTIVGKAYDAVSSAATQFIVLNPIFHGANQLVQSMIAAGNFRGLGMGWIRLAKGVGTVTEEDALHYLSNGGHIPSYGSDVQNMLSLATKGITKLSSKGMAGIEYRLRVGLYKASLDSGMSPKEAIANIDKFLGDTKQMSQATRRVTLFAHYFKTMVKAPLNQIAHPVQNAGSIVNTAAVAGILFGMTEGYKAFTGNSDAYVRMPGEIGMIKEGVKAVGEVAGGEIPSVLTNHINPVAKELVQQAIPNGGLDLFTGKQVDQGGGIADRATHAFNSLVAPSQPTSQVTEGKRTVAEIGANQLGLYTPHAKGYETTTNPNLDLLNTQDSLRGQGNGKAGQTAYFDGVKAAKGAVPQGDTQTADDLNSFLDHSHDPKTGQTIQMSPRESINNSGALATNDTLRGIVQKMEQSQPSHDPIWDLPDDKLKLLMQYRGQFTGDAGKSFLKSQQTDANGGNWIDDVSKQSQDYYNNIKRPPGLPPLKNGPEFPKFDTNTQKLLDTYNTADSATKRTLMQSYSGELSGAFNQIAQYTNAMRRAEGAPEKNDYPIADKATQDAMNAYNALPQHDGSKGGNATRYAWSQANPQAYALMQSYLTKATLNSLVGEAAKAQFKGSTPSDKLLSDIYNMGQYDIQKTKDANGNAQYAIGSSNGSSSSGSSKSSSSRRIRAYRGRSNLDKPDKVRQKKISNSVGKIKIGKRLSTSSNRGPKVTIKKSKV